jgi:hypothetical protein
MPAQSDNQSASQTLVDSVLCVTRRIAAAPGTKARSYVLMGFLTALPLCNATRYEKGVGHVCTKMEVSQGGMNSHNTRRYATAQQAATLPTWNTVASITQAGLQKRPVSNIDT